MSKELQEIELEIVELRQRILGLEEKMENQAKILASLTARVLPNVPALGSYDKSARARDQSPYSIKDRKEGKNPTPPKPREENKSQAGGPSFNEQALAGTWFNRLGVVAILLALAFFLKWSFDNNLVGNLGRVVIGIILGLGFITAGEYSQRKHFAIYGQGLTGGGIAILYLAIFGAFQIYHLVSQPVALLLMVLITLADSLLSVRYNAMAIGILGIVGGFATPFLLSNGQSNMFALFTYAVILDLGVFIVSYFKKWYLFNYLTFVFTFFTFITGYILDFRRSSLWFAMFYLSIFFVIYLGISFVWNVRLKEKTQPLDLVLIFANAAVYFAISYSILATDYKDYMGFFAAFLGAVYVLIGNFTYRENKGDPNLSLTLLGVAVGFITLAIPLQLEQYSIAIAWTIEGAVLIWLSFHFESFCIKMVGLGVLAIALLYLLEQPFRIDGSEFVVLLNKAALAYLAVIVILAVTVIFLKRADFDTRDRSIFNGLQIAINVIAIILITQEIFAYFSYLSVREGLRTFHSTDARDLTLSVAWMLYASLLTLVGFMRKHKSLRLFGLGFLVMVIFKVFLFDLSNLDTPFRILSFVVLGCILLAISWLYQKYKYLIIGEEDKNEAGKGY